MKLIIAGAAVCVAALVIAGAWMIMDDSGDKPESQANAVQITAKKAPVKASGALDIRKRPPRMLDPRAHNMAERALPVPTPQKRDDYVGHGGGDRKENVQKGADTATREPVIKGGPVPTEVTLENSKRLVKEGRFDQAEKLLRNAILSEPNPLSRKRLENELEKVLNPDGERSAPTSGQLK